MMVTWFYFGEAPATSHTKFTSMAACQAARHEVALSATQLKYEAETEAQEARQRGITNLWHLPAPTVSAVCVPQ
jgi:hypothetical protein